MTEKTIGAELHSIGNLIKRISDNSCICKYHRQSGLTEMQTRVIGFLYCSGEKEIFQKDIEKEFSVRRATVSVLLNTMERKQLIIRESVAHDARLKKVLLTEKAKKLAATAQQDIARFEAMLEDGISKEDMEAFYRVTEMIRHNIEKNFITKEGADEKND